MKQYDLIIIGTGGGTKLRPAANLGKKVAVIEKEDFGGTCLNRGCIPSKMLIYPADMITHLREIHKFGITVSQDIQVDWEGLVTRVTETVKKDSASIKPGYDKHPNIDVYQGHGRFVSDKVVEVNGEQLTAEKIYIATGSRPMIPAIPGLEGTPYMTSREALRNTKQPKKMIVVGAGFIALELGHFYGACGTDVHFLVRSEMIRSEDSDIKRAFAEDFSNRYNVHTGTSPKAVRYENETFYVTVADVAGNESVMEADALMIATGVVPNADDLGLKNTSILTNEKGYVKANDYLETTVPGVYAMGDVVGNFLFRHSVNFEGEYLFRQHFLGEVAAPIKYPPMPRATFTHPQTAAVGATEDELIAQGKTKGIDYVVGLNTYKASAMGMAMLSDQNSLVKIIVDKQTRKMLGCHVIGEQASNMIHMLIAYMTMDATIDKVLEMIYIHPALPEIVRNAARKALIELER